MNIQQINHHYSDYHFSSDKGLVQWDIVHEWLSNQSYWSKNVPFETVRSAGENSFCIGVYHDGKQIGYSRIITDYSTFGYLADVYIISEHRKKGLSKIMMQCIMQLPWINNLRRFMLATKSAHGLYEQFGFTAPANPGVLMEINKPDIYR